MKKKTVYRNAPKDVADALMVAEPVPDFLPSPEQLVFKEESVKVTLSLSKDSIAFFKQRARELHVPYQRMIKTVVDKYARRFQSA